MNQLISLVDPSITGNRKTKGLSILIQGFNLFICLCVCVSVCICVHNLTSVPSDLLPVQLSACRIRRPVGNSLDNSPPRLSTETISLAGGRWSLIDNQIFF